MRTKRNTRRQKRRASASMLTSGRLSYRCVQRLMHDRARRFHARDSLARHESQAAPSRHAIRCQDRAAGRVPKDAARAALRVAQKHVDFVRRRPRKLPGAMTADPAPEMHRKNCVATLADIHRILPRDLPAGQCCRIVAVDEPIKLLPGQALSRSGRPRLDYLAVASLAFPLHGEQRRAGGAERHRYLVHRPRIARPPLRRSARCTGRCWSSDCCSAASVSRCKPWWRRLTAAGAMRGHLRPPGRRCGHRCSRCPCLCCWR